MEKTVKIPVSVLASAQSLDELDDWLSANNPKFMARVRTIRKDEDLEAQGKDLMDILKKWPI
jgi:hypothetical protein